MPTFPLTDYKTFLESILTPARMRHSLGVMQVMGDLAEIYDLDCQTALAAGLLHDAAKDLSPAQQAEVLTESGIVLTDPCECDYNFYLHGPLGAYFVKKELGVSDPLVLEAITRHTWCGTDADLGSPLVWCLRFADILEPNRRWDERARSIQVREPRLREAVYGGRLEEAVFRQTQMLLCFLEAVGQPIHPNYHAAYRVLSSRHNPADFIEE